MICFSIVLPIMHPVVVWINHRYIHSRKPEYIPPLNGVTCPTFIWHSLVAVQVRQNSPKAKLNVSIIPIKAHAVYSPVRALFGFKVCQ